MILQRFLCFSLLCCSSITKSSWGWTSTTLMNPRQTQYQNKILNFSWQRQSTPSPSQDGEDQAKNNDSTSSSVVGTQKGTAMAENSGNPDNVAQPKVTSTQSRSKNIPPSRELSINEVMIAMGTSPRRIALASLSATGIALAGNFLGVTSKLLQSVPESTVEASGLDTYYPRGNVKRIRGKGYTFVIPKEWVADTALELAKAQRRAKTLDYSLKQSSGGGVLPDAAFGPPGRLNAKGVSEGDTNVSLIVNSGLKGFSLRGTLGSPTSAAETLLRVSLAPPGSGRTGTLVNAYEDSTRNGLYQFEYTVDRGQRGPPLRAISVIAEKNGDTLITMTVVAPQQEWEDPIKKEKLERIASSFHLR